MLKASETQSLETYLAQIARELRDLPAPARADELREIEAHLRAMIEARGDVAGVLAQFGKPRKVGRDLRRAWERKQPEAWWRAILAPIIATTFYVVIGLPLLHGFMNLSVALSFYGMPLIPSALDFVGCFLMSIASYIAGLISPKRGLIGMLFLLFLTTLNGIVTEDFLHTSWIVLSTTLYVSTVIGTYFGARCGRNISFRRADAK